jgi:uncharacterized protein YuzE
MEETEAPHLAERRPRRVCIEDIEKVWFEYDKQSDILYIHFADPEEEAEEAIMTENEIVFRIKDGKLLGMTIMEFSRKSGYQC